MSKHRCNLKARGYTPAKVNKLLELITFYKREQALLPKKLANKGSLTFVNTFNNFTPQVSILS